MSQVRRRLPVPRIRDWKTVVNRQRPLSRPSSTDKLQVLYEDEPFSTEGVNEPGRWQDVHESKPKDPIPDLCDPDLELSPVISQSPFPKRTTIMQNVMKFEASISPDNTDADKDCSLRKYMRENRSLDSIAPHLSSAKKALWSSSSVIPGRSSCDSPPMILEPHCPVLSTRPDSPNERRSPTNLFMPESVTLTVDHRISEPVSSEQYGMLQSVTQSAFMEAIEDPSLPKTSIQIFPHGMSRTGIQFQDQAPAVDRFLLAHQIRRISIHRSKMHLDQDADRRLASDHIVQAFNERNAKLRSQAATRSNSDGSDSDIPVCLNTSNNHSDAREESHSVQGQYLDEGQYKAANFIKADVFGEPESELTYKTTRKGIYMDIGIDDEHGEEGKINNQRKVPAFVRRKSRISRQNFNKPLPSPRPDSRLLPRSNRVLIRNALTRVCLAGGATGVERARALDALESCPSEWFIILLREQRHKFRGLYRVESGNEGDSPVMIRIFGDGPLQILTNSIYTFFKYDSANKCFDSLPARHLTATTDAVSIIPKRFGSKPSRTM